MEGLPYLYDYVNAVTSQSSPSTVHCRNSALSQYFQKYLLEKALSVFRFELPEWWERNYVLYTLYCHGYFAVVRTDRYGVIPQHCSLYGYNIMYQPTNAIICNPLLSGNLQPRIGRQCEVVKLQPNYSGIMDIVAYYADMLALCAESAGMNLVNSKVSYAFATRTKNGAETFKKMFDKIQSGEPAVFYDSDLTDELGERWQLFDKNVKNSYIVNDILEAMRKIELMFDNDIGIPNANTEKKERMITDEVNANNFEARSKCELWLEEIQKGFEKVNAMFGLNLSVTWRNEVMENDNDQSDGDL